MDSDLLKTFLQVSHTRHFGRAAEALYLTQSAVSFRIRQLENQIGTTLFIRHRNNIQLTPAGERLIPYAESLMKTWNLAKQEIAGAQQHRHLSVGASTLLWESVLTPWLQTQLHHPHSSTIETRIASRQVLVKQLHDRHLDLLVTTSLPKMEELHSKEIGQISMALFCSQRSRAAEKFHYIKLEWDEENNPEYNRFYEAVDNPVLITPSAQFARQIMQNLMAYASLPAHWQYDYPELSIIPEAPVITRTLYAVWWQKNDQQTLINQIVNHRVTI